MAVAPRTVVVHLADQRRDRTDSHGIINFSLGLVASLPRALAPTTRLVVLANTAIATEIDDSRFRPGDEVSILEPPGRGSSGRGSSGWGSSGRAVRGAGRVWLDHVAVGRRAAELDADVVVYPKGFLPWRPRPASAWHVPVFHDDIVTRRFRDPELALSARAKAAYFHLLARHSLRTADRRLFVSGVTATGLLGGEWAAGRDRVIGEGIDVPVRDHVPLVERDPHVLVFGSRFAHKRIDEGLATLVPLLPAGLRRVVVIGPAPAPLGREVAGDVEIEARPGPLSSEELADVMARARLLFYPSDHEGFGLPPIEAHACGTPALFRGNPAAVEMLGDRPGRFDSPDAATMSAALGRALALDDGRLRAIATEVRARFDWATVADAVAEMVEGDQIP